MDSLASSIFSYLVGLLLRATLTVRNISITVEIKRRYIAMVPSLFNIIKKGVAINHSLKHLKPSKL